MTVTDELDWQDISTAPRDGREVELTWMDDGDPQERFIMRWDATATNTILPSGVVGLWVAPDGPLTWSEHNPDGAPTHWRPVRAMVAAGRVDGGG